MSGNESVAGFGCISFNHLDKFSGSFDVRWRYRFFFLRKHKLEAWRISFAVEIGCNCNDFGTLRPVCEQ